MVTELSRCVFVLMSFQAQSQLDKLKGEVREVATMKQAAVAITRLLKDTDRLAQETAGLEDALSATGSTKTADDVQLELDTIGGELCVLRASLSWSLLLTCVTSSRTIDTEKRMLAQERERQLQGISSHEKDLHAMQLNESKLRNDLREREHLEERIGHYKKEIASCSAKSKVRRRYYRRAHALNFPQDVDTKLAEAQAPIDQLEEEHRTAKSQLETQFSQAQELAQSITRDHDKLEGDNRAIEKYACPSLVMFYAKTSSGTSVTGAGDG
jgi:DNA repair protein RAD50